MPSRTGSRTAGRDGGAHGNRAGYSFDGGQTWAFSAPRVLPLRGWSGPRQCRRLPEGNRPLALVQPERPPARDRASCSTTPPPRNAVLAAFSDDGGASWSTPRILRFDNPRALGNNFNDKETLTAVPFQLVAGVCDVAADRRAQRASFPRGPMRTPSSFYSEAWFARSTNGGPVVGAGAADLPGARGALTQTIGNQVEVLVDGTLINGFNLIHANEQPPRAPAATTSRWCGPPDKGLTCRTGDLRQPPAVRRGHGSR